MAMTVSSLRPGTAFRIYLGPNSYLDYRLVYANECRAYVEPLMRSKRTIARKNDDLSDLTGEATVLAEFDAPSGGKVNIAPGTEVDELLDQPDEDDDDLTGAPAKTRPVIATQGQSKRGDRHFDPTPQARPVRPNTTRADMLAALIGGETSLAALAKKFGQKTSLTVAHIHEMWKCHGYGYTVKGDKVTIKQPVGILAPKSKKKDDLEDIL